MIHINYIYIHDIYIDTYVSIHDLYRYICIMVYLPSIEMSIFKSSLIEDFPLPFWLPEGADLLVENGPISGIF